MQHSVTSYMKQNKSRKQTLESAQYGLENSFNTILVPRAYDPSSLRQESRALGASISGMRHRWRLS